MNDLHSDIYFRPVTEQRLLMSCQEPHGSPTSWIFCTLDRQVRSARRLSPSMRECRSWRYPYLLNLPPTQVKPCCHYNLSFVPFTSIKNFYDFFFFIRFMTMSQLSMTDMAPSLEAVLTYHAQSCV